MGMAEDEPGPKRPQRVVDSEYAEPSRPGGYEGVRQPMADAPATPPADQPADAALADAVRARMADEGRLEGCSIEARVEGGRVALSGTVTQEFQRTLAEACAAGVPGVLVVMNSLSVGQTGTKTPKQGQS